MSKQPSFFERFVSAFASDPHGGEFHEVKTAPQKQQSTSAQPSIIPQTPTKTQKPPFTSSRASFPHNFLHHTTESPFDYKALRSLETEPEESQQPRRNPQLFRSLTVGATQVGLNSGAWFAATAATLGLVSSKSLGSFLKMVRENPAKFVEGSQWLIPYNILIAGVTTKAQQAAQGDDHSPLGVARGVAAGTAAETFVGNFFDYKSLQNMFLITKIRNTPGVFEKLTDDQLKAILPKSAAATREGFLQEIAEHPNRVDYGGKNLAMLQKATGVCLTMQDGVRANAAMTLPAALRNSYFYLLLAYSHKTASEGTPITPTQLASGSLVGAAFTFIPNAITYGAADEVMKGKTVLQSLKDSIATFRPGSGSTMSPTQAAAVFGVRALVMYITTKVLTKDSEEKIGEAVDKVFGTTKEDMDKEVEEIMTDPAKLEQTLRECEIAAELLDAVVHAKSKKEKTAAPSTITAPSTQESKQAKQLAEQKPNPKQERGGDARK